MDRKSITAVIRWGNGSTTEVCKAIIGSNRCARRTRCASETKRNNAVSVDAPWSPRPSRAGVRNVRHRSSLATFQSGPFKRFGAEPLHTLSTVKRPSDRMPRTAALAGSSSSFMLCRCSLACISHHAARRSAWEGRQDEARAAWRAQAYLNSTLSTASKRNACGLYGSPALGHFFLERNRSPPRVFTNHESRDTNHGFLSCASTVGW